MLNLLYFDISIDEIARNRSTSKIELHLEMTTS